MRLFLLKKNDGDSAVNHILGKFVYLQIDIILDIIFKNYRLGLNISRKKHEKLKRHGKKEVFL